MGIGRPADKRASHVLPRYFLGTAREAELSERRGDRDWLNMWLALELRRAQQSFDAARKEQDARLIGTVGQKSGVRIKALHKAGSQITIALLDSFALKFREFQTQPEAFNLARGRILDFVDNVGRAATALSLFVTKDNNDAAVKRVEQLNADLRIDTENAFALMLKESFADDVGQPLTPALAKIPALPRLPEPRLSEWWSALSAEDKGKPQGALLDMCRAAHPSNSISRERVRLLDTGRKRGPKPFGANRTAQLPLK